MNIPSGEKLERRHLAGTAVKQSATMNCRQDASAPGGMNIPYGEGMYISSGRYIETNAGWPEERGPAFPTQYRYERLSAKPSGQTSMARFTMIRIKSRHW
ncbi:MAG: hypothetical protein ACRER2_03610 [Methylococcales bacterium]